MQRLVLFVLFLAGCSKAPAATPDAAPSVSASVTIVAVEAAPPAPTRQRFSTAFAHFSGNKLFECIDVSLEVPSGKDAGVDPMAPLEKDENFKKLTRLPQSCAQQFSDRTTLATCSVHDQEDAGTKSVDFTSSFYDYEDVGLTDQHMAGCLKAKGSWKAISRDSPEWQRAKLDYDQHKLRKAVGKLTDER